MPSPAPDTRFDDALKSALTARDYLVIETHLSRVFLAGDDVYKTKRAVRFSFVDFSTDAARRSACDAEVELNARFAPHVYLGVVAITLAPDGSPRFHAPDAPLGDEPHTWAVHMRRLREADRADVLLAQGSLGEPEIASIARTLVHFHARCRSDADTARLGAEPVLRGNVEENFRELAQIFARYLSPEDEARLVASQRQWLSGHGALLARRARSGHVRDGHGDLRLEHVYRAEDGEFFAIDCIEFNDRFRYGDVALDIAFLAMDLHLHQRADLAELFLAEYARESFDYELYASIDFYVSYRAVVRAKVSAFLAADPSVSEASRARGEREAKKAFALALASLAPRAAEPVLIVCCGLMASGKSTLARRLGARLGAPVVSADRVRKRLLGAELLSAHHDAPFRGSYSEEITDQVYETLRTHARLVLSSRRSVLLDATFRSRSERAEIRELADDLGVPVVFVECAVPRHVAMARLAERALGKSESDGRPEIFDAVARMFQPLSELEPGQYLRLDTSTSLDENLTRCEQRLAELRRA